eukprot:6331324-Prymnesium_polylepis.1
MAAIQTHGALYIAFDVYTTFTKPEDCTPPLPNVEPPGQTLCSDIRATALHACLLAVRSSL